MLIEERRYSTEYLSPVSGPFPLLRGTTASRIRYLPPSEQLRDFRVHILREETFFSPSSRSEREVCWNFGLCTRPLGNDLFGASMDLRTRKRVLAASDATYMSQIHYYFENRKK